MEQTWRLFVTASLIKNVQVVRALSENRSVIIEGY